MDLEAKVANDQNAKVTTSTTNGTSDIPNTSNPKRILSQHRDSITSVHIHAQYGICVTGSEDCTAKIWDIESGELEATLKGHTKGVTDVRFNNSTSTQQSKIMLATSSHDLTIKIWTPENGTETTQWDCIRTLIGHDQTISNIRWAGENALLSVSRDTTMRKWDTETG